MTSKGVKIKRRGKTIQTSAFSRDEDELYSYPSKRSSKLLDKVARKNKTKIKKAKNHTGGTF